MRLSTEKIQIRAVTKAFEQYLFKQITQQDTLTTTELHTERLTFVRELYCTPLNLPTWTYHTQNRM